MGQMGSSPQKKQQVGSRTKMNDKNQAIFTVLDANDF